MHVSLMWAGEGAELMRAETNNDLVDMGAAVLATIKS